MRFKKLSRLLLGAAAVAGVLSTSVGSVAAVEGTITDFLEGQAVTMSGTSHSFAGLIELTTADGVLQTYCIDLFTNTNIGVAYEEGTWDAANVNAIPAVQAILLAGYPIQSEAQLAVSAAAAGLTKNQAAAATQAAIWHVTDAVSLDAGGDTNVQKVYDYLLTKADGGGVDPAPTVSISPANLAGVVGSVVGPFTLNTTAAAASVTVSAGATITDAGGAPLVPTTNGSVFYVLPGAAGTFTVTAKASGPVPTGRVFLPIEGKHQKLILAKSTNVEATAEASVDAKTPQVTTTTMTPEVTTTTETPEVTTTTTAAAVTTTSAAATTTAAPTTSVLQASGGPTTTVQQASGGPTVPAVVVPEGAVLPETGGTTGPGVFLAAGALLVGLGAIVAARRGRTT